jgi:hypothetical protein
VISVTENLTNVTGDNIDPLKCARAFLASAVASQVDAGGRMARALTSIAASLVAQTDDRVGDLARVEREAYDRGHANAEERILNSRAEAFVAAIELLPRVESLEVRADFAEALGAPLVITPEDPDPGRDWSRVEAHLFNPNGKWKYQAWLDYTGERHRGVPGEGPAGWHFDGTAMAKRALARATGNGTSEVTIYDLGEYWHLFVPHPPQGYPHWVRPGDPDERVDV